MTDIEDPNTSRETAGASPVQRPLSWMLLLGFMLIVAIARGAYASNGAERSARFSLVATFGLLALLWFSFSAQVAPYQPRLMLDMGLMLLIFWFVSFRTTCGITSGGEGSGRYARLAWHTLRPLS